MPSKLKKAIGAVKDQTSISLAKVVNTNSASLEVAVLKATTHDKAPFDERYVDEILRTVSSNKLFAGIAARVIAKRLGKTKNWVVALKCLMLVLRIFQDGDPYFPKEVLHAMNHRTNILNLPTFRDECSSSPCDYTAFVKSFAFYLEERLECFLTGKLQRRFTFKEKQLSHPRARRANQQPVRHMKPPMLLDRISYWQRLLAKAIATKPIGSAKTNRLILVSFHAIVRESFDLYRDISNGLGLVLDGFFHLQHQSCVNAINYCVKASKQFEELSSLYEYCKSLPIGRTSDYPSVQRISEELIETLKVFLKDQASFPSAGISPPTKPHRLLRLLTSAAKDLSLLEIESQAGSSSIVCTSLEELMNQDEEPVVTMRSSFSTGTFWELSEKQYREQEDSYNAAETGSNHSLPIDQDQNTSLDFISFDEWPAVDANKTQGQQSSEPSSSSANGDKGCWELALIEPTPSPQPVPQASQNLANNNSFFGNWFQQDHRNQQASQTGVKVHSYIDDWLLQQHHQQQWQASNDVANGHTCFDDWLKEDKSPEHAPNQIVVSNGRSYFDDWFQANQRDQEERKSDSNWSNNGGNESWELVLVEGTTPPSQASQHLADGIQPSMANNLFDHRPIVPQRQYNPFLEDETNISAAIATTVAGFQERFFPMEPTFHATPTFYAQSCNIEIPTPTFHAMPGSVSQHPNGTTTTGFQGGETGEPFAPWPTMKANNNVSVDQQNVLFQRQLWLQ
ncbi:clathrin coat assembly protein AP180 [Gossypium raimondii]|uniref:clathrin coat assembly protein AP180 n=1 Tax=Gossypium raimondii TaxID=29730 RepID=UPI00227B0F6B|nr:clathrin coat assembly protein AP180 [Gossypium raimondii]